MKKIVIISFILLLGLGKIYSQNKNKNNLSSISLSSSINNPQDIGVSELVTDINYVKLETTNQSLLGRIQLLVATENFFFVWDSRGIYQFARTGKFLRQVGKIGKGPGEYLGVRDMCVDKENKKFYVLTNWTGDVLVYDFEGKYLSSIKLQGVSKEKIDGIGKGLFAFQVAPLEKTILSTEIINEKGASLLKFNSRIYLTTDKMKFGKGTSNISYLHNNEVFVKEMKNDTVYKITSKGLVPYIVYDLGNFKPPFTYSNQDRPKYIEIYRIFESDNYIVTFFFHKGTNGTAVYNKTSHKTVVSMPTDKSKIGLLNDYDNGLNFFASPIPFALKTNLKEWILPIQPDNLIDFRDKKKANGNFKNLLDHFHEGDNPVIMILKVK